MNLYQSYKTPTRRKKRNTRRRKQRVTKMRKNTRKYHGIRKTRKRKFGGMTNNGNESENSNESFNLEDSDEFSDIEIEPSPLIVRNRNRPPPNPREDTSDSDVDSVRSVIRYYPTQELSQIDIKINNCTQQVDVLITIINSFYVELSSLYAQYYSNLVKPDQVIKRVTADHSIDQSIQIFIENRYIFVSIVDSMINSIFNSMINATPVDYPSIKHISRFISNRFIIVDLRTRSAKNDLLNLRIQIDRHLSSQPHHTRILKMKRTVVSLIRRTSLMSFPSFMSAKNDELKEQVRVYESAHRIVVPNIYEEEDENENENENENEHEDEDED